MSKWPNLPRSMANMPVSRARARLAQMMVNSNCKEGRGRSYNAGFYALEWISLLQDLEFCPLRYMQI